LPALAGQTSYTVTLTGLGSASTITTFTDDISTAAAASVRFISAKLGSQPLGMTANGLSIFTNVSYATVPAMTSNIDANGYASLGYSGTFQLDFADSTGTILVAPGVIFTGGSYNSIFTIPPPPNHSGTLSAFVCFDSLQPVGGMTQCLPYP
jgi:hypothetical protein